MKLAEYISDLLYRYECVIIPDFGGFVTNTKSARVSSNVFYPPYKQITFNTHLKNNDGLLANYIASVDRMPFKTAMNFVKFEVKQWKEHLINNDLLVEGVGVFKKEGDTLLFEPQKKINYDTESFGLNSVISQEIKREKHKKSAEIFDKKPPVVVASKTKEQPNYLKYAAFWLIGLALLGLGANEAYKSYERNQEIVAAKKQQKVLQDKIQEATFIVSEPLPSILLNATLTTKPYHVIAGAFRVPGNAERMITILKNNGYNNARILGINQWGLTQVSFDSFNSRNEAINVLRNVQKTFDNDAWLLVQDL